MEELQIKTDWRVCFWGARARVQSASYSEKQCLNDAGQNSGNLFIGAGLFNNTVAPVKEYWDFYGKDPKEFDDNFDILFVPASNFLYANTDLSDQFRFFSQTRARIFMFGLGSQTRDLEHPRLTSGTENFVRLADERSGGVGVRGEFTAEIARKMGVKNVVVTGCPSLLRMPSGFEKAENDRDPVLAANFTNNAREHSFDERLMKAFEAKLFSRLLEVRGFYVLQNERLELDLVRALRYEESDSPETSFALNYVGNSFDCSDVHGLRDLMRWRTRIFFQTQQWIAFLRNCSISIGTRFHGNVAAVHAGVPVMIYCHDYRTLELARFYKLPHRIISEESVARFSLQRDVEEADMAPFLANQSRLFQIWKDFVSSNQMHADVVQTVPASSHR